MELNYLSVHPLFQRIIDTCILQVTEQGYGTNIFVLLLSFLFGVICYSKG